MNLGDKGGQEQINTKGLSKEKEVPILLIFFVPIILDLKLEVRGY